MRSVDGNAENTGRNGPGRMLRDAREARGLEVQAVARTLHLHPRTIAALEADDFAALPAPIFVRGYLNAYCKLLGEPADEYLDAYSRAAGDPEPPPLVVSRGTGDEVHGRSGRVTLVSWLIGLAALGMVVLWWVARPPPSPPDVQVAEGLPAPVVEAEPQPTPASVDETVQPEQGQDRVSVSTEDVTLAPPVGFNEGLVRMRLEFEQESWAEVTDADAQRLYFDLARAGSSVTVEGRPPLTVFLGNAPGVRVFVDDERFDHGPFTRRGNVARFRVGEARTQ